MVCHPEHNKASVVRSIFARFGKARKSTRSVGILSLLACASVAVHAQRLELAITVDDLPTHGQLPPGVTREAVAQSFLDTFQREHLPPVYGFVNGAKVEKDPSTLRVLEMWHAAGQPLGNHTWSHWNLTRIPSETFLSEVDKNQTLLDRIDPHGDTRWLRYPYLHEGDTVEKRRAVRAGLAARGMRIAEVTMDFEDYLWNDPYARCSAMQDEAALQYLHDSYLATADRYIGLYRGLAKQAYGRDIRYVLLMHVGAFDAKMLPELLNLYRTRGFRFVTMQRALADKAYRIDPDIGDPDGGTLTDLLLEARHVKVAADVKPYEKLDKLCRVPPVPNPAAPAPAVAVPHLP